MDLILRFRPTPEELEAELTSLSRAVPKVRRWAIVAIDLLAGVILAVLGLVWIAAILGLLAVYHTLMLLRGDAGRIGRAAARWDVDTTVNLGFDGYEIRDSERSAWRHNDWRHTKVVDRPASWVFFNAGRIALVIPKRALTPDEREKLTVLLSGVEAERTERRL
jgi:hypothetical protein